MNKLIQPLLNEKETEALRSILEYLSDESNEYATLSTDERRQHIYHSVLTLRASSAGLSLDPPFALGCTVATPGATKALMNSKQDAGDFLRRHHVGDWGDVSAEDWQENELSLENGFRLLSRYCTKEGEVLWIVTEPDRSVTTILLPEEY